jgi:hypothetical protein
VKAGWRALVAAGLAAGLVACGGSGDSPAPGATAPPPAPPAPPAAGSPLTVGATLATGTVLEYLATHTSSTSSPAGNSTRSDFGLFRLTLGEPRQVAGVTGFDVQVSGRTVVGGQELRPPWTFLALVGTRWVGSVDGVHLVTLYDATAPAGASGFFLGATGTRRLAAAPGRHEGAYNVYRGVALADAASDGGCQWVLSLTLCSAATTTFEQRELLIDGIGPAAYQQQVGYSVSGSAPQVIRRTLAVELVRTTLVARDGSVVREPPWRAGLDMPVARTGAQSVVLDERVYLFGGRGSDASLDGRRVDFFDLRSQRWYRAPDAPRSLAGWRATTAGSRIALFGGTDGLLFDPANGSWTATGRLLASGSITGVGQRTRPDGRVEVLAILDPGSTFLQASLVSYLPSNNSWQTIGSFERGPRGQYEAVFVAGNFHLIGGFQGGRYLDAVSVLDSQTLQMRRLPDNLAEGVVQPAVAVQGHRIVVAGGFNFGGARRGVQIIDTATGRVSEGPPLLGPLQEAAAAAALGRVMLFGGRSGAEGSTASAEVWLLDY